MPRRWASALARRWRRERCAVCACARPDIDRTRSSADQNGPVITSPPPPGASHPVTIRCSPPSWRFHRTQPTPPATSTPPAISPPPPRLLRWLTLALSSSTCWYVLAVLASLLAECAATRKPSPTLAATTPAP